MITREGADRARLRPWLVAGLALWIEIGIVLVDRGTRLGQVEDVEFSPSHLVGYAGLGVLAVYVAWSFLRALRYGRWRQAFPGGYGGVGLGFACFIGWVLLDGIWRSTFGMAGIENGLGPTRLLLPLGVVLLASGPLRQGLDTARRTASASILTAGPAVLSVGVIGAALTLVAYNPVRDPWNDLATAGARDSAEIWSMAADGTRQTRVLAALETGIDFSLPAWSPDGTQIAYTRWHNLTAAAANARAEDQTAGIWVMSADGSNPHQVVDGAPGQAWIPAWSPDGRWIAYTVSSHGGSSGTSAAAPQPEPNGAPGQLGPPASAGGDAIWIIHPDGTGAMTLTAPQARALAATWSPVGNRIAYDMASADGTTDVHIATVTDSGLQDDVAIAADPANDWGPAWSPDGTKLAFTSNRSGNDEIWTIGADGSGLTRITENGDGDWVPAWSPDGRRIAYVSDHGDDVEIWTMAVDGSDRRDISNDPARDDGRWSVAWSPDGKSLVYTSTGYPVGSASGFVREDLAAAITILWGLSLAAVALLLVAVGGSGGFAVALTLIVAMAALASDQWRFLPAAVIAGLVVDLLVRWSPPRLRARVAAIALPALAVLGIGLTLSIGGTAAWSVTLLLGAVGVVGLFGWGLAELVRKLSAAPS